VPHQIRWSRKAEQDLVDVLRWFQSQSATQAGADWFVRIQEATKNLRNNPAGYPLAAESENLAFELREMLFGKRRGQYRVLFVIDVAAVVVLHVRHAARDAATEDDLGRSDSG
jgi:plasmid stabilization system protein ParE